MSNCRRCSIGAAGTRTGKRPATATTSSRENSDGNPTSRCRKVWLATSRAATHAGRMLKVAIVGCGKIADAHASQIQRIAGCRMVGACDREPLMARQLVERFPIARAFGDLPEMLDAASPDVVHVTTPPASHFEIARLCLDRGIHVYVEKPFTLNLPEAEALVALAEQRGVRITAGHDDQFSHVARRMRRVVQSG